MRVKIIGQGVWGKAIFSLLQQNGIEVTFVSRGETIADCDVLVLCVPTKAIRECLQNLSDKTITIVNTSKGIEKDTHFLPYQIVTSVLGSDVKYYSLMGPSFAQEIMEKMPTFVNLGYTPMSETEVGGSAGYSKEDIRKLFQTDFFHVRLNDGVKALEINGAFKNIYAIACGMIAGLGYGYNTRALFLAMAIKEMNALLTSFGFRFDKLAEVGTVGDLVMTCSSEESRNFRFGKMLPSQKVEDCLKALTTVEGYNSIASLSFFETEAKQQLPFAELVAKIIAENNPANVRSTFENFFKNL